MQISCTRCTVPLPYKEDSKRMCDCRTAYYCSNACRRIDRERHAEHCDAEMGQQLTMHTYFGAASLFKVCTGIFYDPCEAYAYALLVRLGVPKEILRTIPIAEKGDPRIYNILRTLSYDAAAFATTVYKAMQVHLTEEVPTTSLSNVPHPEVFVSMARYELSLLYEAGPTRANEMAVFLMVNAVDPSMRDVTGDHLIKFYDRTAKDPLQSIIDRVNKGN